MVDIILVYIFSLILYKYILIFLFGVHYITRSLDWFVNLFARSIWVFWIPEGSLQASLICTSVICLRFQRAVWLIFQQVRFIYKITDLSLAPSLSLSLTALSPNGKVKFNTADGRCRRVLSARHESDTSSATTDRKACFIRVQISIYGIHIYTSSADKTAGEDGNFSFLFQSKRGICATLGHTDYLRSDALLNWSKLIIHLNTLISVSLSAPLLYMHNEPPMTCTMN